MWARSASPDTSFSSPRRSPSRSASDAAAHRDRPSVLSGSDAGAPDFAAILAWSTTSASTEADTRAAGWRRDPARGRDAAVADVFDALTSDRIYRPAQRQRGRSDDAQPARKHFDRTCSITSSMRWKRSKRSASVRRIGDSSLIFPGDQGNGSRSRPKLLRVAKQSKRASPSDFRAFEAFSLNSCFSVDN